MKTFRSLGPGESIYKVGTMGEIVGVTFQSYYAYASLTIGLKAEDQAPETCGK